MGSFNGPDTTLKAYELVNQLNKDVKEKLASLTFTESKQKQYWINWPKEFTSQLNKQGILCMWMVQEAQIDWIHSQSC